MVIEERDLVFPPGASRPRIPRITRLMALAIKFQEMVKCGEVRDYADPRPVPAGEARFCVKIPLIV
jgi:hypothetical protein